MIVCSFLQEFSKGKESTLHLICNAHTAFLLCRAAFKESIWMRLTHSTVNIYTRILQFIHLIFLESFEFIQCTGIILSRSPENHLKKMFLSKIRKCATFCHSHRSHNVESAHTVIYEPIAFSLKHKCIKIYLYFTYLWKYIYNLNIFKLCIFIIWKLTHFCQGGKKELSSSWTILNILSPKVRKIINWIGRLEFSNAPTQP